MPHGLLGPTLLHQSAPDRVAKETTALRHWFILAALVLARIGVGYQYQTVATLGPGLVPLFHLTYAEFGSLIGAYMVLGVFVALPFGVLARWSGDRLMLGGGLAMMVAGSCMSVWGGDPAGIAAGRIIAGVGAVAVIVMQNKVIADWFSGRRFMMAISVSVASYPVGVGAAQLILPPVAQAFGWQAGFLTGAGVTGVALLVFLASFRPVPHPAERDRSLGLPSRREWVLLLISGLTWTAYTAGYGGYTSYIPSTLAARGEGLALTGLVMTTATWGNVPATLFGGGLAGRYGGFRIFLIGTIALVVGMAGTVWADWPVLWAIAIGIVGSIHPGVIVAVGTLSVRPRNRAIGMGIFYSVYYAGGAVGPALCGWSADLAGGPAGGILAAAVLSALAVPMYLLHRRLAEHETMLARP